MARHWSERAQLTCSCGHVSRSVMAEARHRHNFPLLCRKSKPQVDRGLTTPLERDRMEQGHGQQTLQAQEVPAEEA